MRSLLFVLLLSSTAWGEHLATITNTRPGGEWDSRVRETNLHARAGAGTFYVPVTLADVGNSWSLPDVDWRGLVHDPTANEFNFGFADSPNGFDDLSLPELFAGNYMSNISFAWLASGVPADYNLTGATVTLDAMTFSPTPGQFQVPLLVQGRVRLDLYGDYFQQPPGDYNQNGEVDGADYVMWRMKFTPPLSEGSLPNESGQTAGFIAMEDFHFWRSQFGREVMPVGAALGSASIPEPGAWLLFLIGLALIHWRNR